MAGRSCQRTVAKVAPILDMPLNFPIKLTNKLGHLNSLVGIDDFPPTDQDIAVKNELTSKINEQLSTFDALISKEIQDFNAEFNQLKLNYLFVE